MLILPVYACQQVLSNQQWTVCDRITEERAEDWGGANGPMGNGDHPIKQNHLMQFWSAGLLSLARVSSHQIG